MRSPAFVSQHRFYLCNFQLLRGSKRSICCVAALPQSILQQASAKGLGQMRKGCKNVGLCLCVATQSINKQLSAFHIHTSLHNWWGICAGVQEGS